MRAFQTAYITNENKKHQSNQQEKSVAARNRKTKGTGQATSPQNPSNKMACLSIETLSGNLYHEKETKWSYKIYSNSMKHSKKVFTLDP